MAHWIQNCRVVGARCRDFGCSQEVDVHQGRLYSRFGLHLIAIRSILIYWSITTSEKSNAQYKLQISMETGPHTQPNAHTSRTRLRLYTFTAVTRQTGSNADASVS